MSLLSSRLEGFEGIALEPQRSLASLTTFRIGGSAELFAQVLSEDALMRLLSEIQEVDVPVHLLGKGSNVLAPDSGLSGVVIHLGGEFEQFRFLAEAVEAGSAVVLARLARAACERDLVGLERLAGFPSTVGGAIVMNAGCYGVEIIELLEWVNIVDPGGQLQQLVVSELGARYRSTQLLGGRSVVTRARLRLTKGDGSAALKKMAEINARRRESLPSGHPNAGSTFRNPEGDYAGRLIEACGLKGERCGGAQISERHANVIVNRGKATAADVLELMVMAYEAVRENHGIALQPELILLGELRDQWFDRVGDSSTG